MLFRSEGPKFLPDAPELVPVPEEELGPVTLRVRAIPVIVENRKWPNNRTMQEQRSEPRYTVREGALVWHLSRIKAGFQTTTILDVSRNGMRLLTDRKLVPGGQVAIDFRGMVISGKVQYCVPEEDRFASGIRIGDVMDQVAEDAA